MLSITLWFLCGIYSCCLPSCKFDWLCGKTYIFLPSCLSCISLICIFQIVPAEVVEALLKACKSGNFDLANKEVNNFIAEGYPVSQMLTQVLFCHFQWEVLLLITVLTQLSLLQSNWFFFLQLFEAIVEENDISDEQKARISKKLGEADKVTYDP